MIVLKYCRNLAEVNSVDDTTIRLLTWKVPTPRGLWHRAFVVTEKGLFLTPDIDTTTMNGLKKAADSDPGELLAQLTGHGRFKRSTFLAWPSITSVRHNGATGIIEVETEDGVTTAKVADRERLEKLARVLAATTAALKQTAD